jgi:hypothetical protein
VQRYKKENRWRQDREEFFLELLDYFVHGTPSFNVDSSSRTLPPSDVTYQIMCSRYFVG